MWLSNTDRNELRLRLVHHLRTHRRVQISGTEMYMVALEEYQAMLWLLPDFFDHNDLQLSAVASGARLDVGTVFGAQVFYDPSLDSSVAPTGKVAAQA